MSLQSDVRKAQTMYLAMPAEKHAVIGRVFVKFKDIALELDQIPEEFLQVIGGVLLTVFTRRITGWNARGTEDAIVTGADQVFAGHEDTVRETVRAVMGAKG